MSHIGRCATRFDPDFASIEDLVVALRGDGCEAILPQAARSRGAM